MRLSAPAARLGPLAVLAGGLALRLYHLGARSLWTDEGSTWTAVAAPLAALVRRCIEREESPPLYYLLTALALRWDGGEVQLRLVSALASALLVWVTYRFARQYAGRGEATLAAALVALSPFQLMYAQEARSYALVALFVVAALYFFARAAVLDRPRAWWPYLLVSALGIWTQDIALLGIGAQAAVMVLSPAARRHLRTWLLAQLAVALLFAPWIVASWGHGAPLSETHWYVRPPGAHGILLLARALFLAPFPLIGSAPAPGLEGWLPRPAAWLALAVLAAGPFVFALRSLTAPAPRGPVLRLALAGLVLPPAAVLAASPWLPVWLPRYFVFLSPPLALLLARGLAALRPRALGVAWAVLLLALQLHGDVRYDRGFAKEPWRELVRHVAATSPPARTAVLVMFDVDPFAYYASRLPAAPPVYEVSHADAPFSGHLSAAQLDEAEAQARARTVGFADVWVVSRNLRSESRRDLAARTERLAAAGRMLAEERAWPSASDTILTRHYRRP